ncbi:MAG TPA: hypothetical protein DCR93_20635 [Cytophagales bacterium]|nr:hypothetical protein [Cytophagales bacterium]HAP61800.1 hypothetical protein [Cytophagales bacterium]
MRAKLKPYIIEWITEIHQLASKRKRIDDALVFTKNHLNDLLDELIEPTKSNKIESAFINGLVRLYNGKNAEFESFGLSRLLKKLADSVDLELDETKLFEQTVEPKKKTIELPKGLVSWKLSGVIETSSREVNVISSNLNWLRQKKDTFFQSFSSNKQEKKYKYLLVGKNTVGQKNKESILNSFTKLERPIGTVEFDIFDWNDFVRLTLERSKPEELKKIGQLFDHYRYDVDLYPLQNGNDSNATNSNFIFNSLDLLFLPFSHDIVIYKDIDWEKALDEMPTFEMETFYSRYGNLSTIVLLGIFHADGVTDDEMEKHFDLIITGVRQNTTVEWFDRIWETVLDINPRKHE